MKKLSRRIKQANQKIEAKLYLAEEAINLIKQTATAKFIESAEAHFALNIDPKYSDQQLRSTFILPHGSGKLKRIAVLLPTEKITSEIENLADLVGSEDLIQSITKGELNFDILLATPEMMPKLAKLGRVLGPKGLMPSPKAGTVTSNITIAINEFKKGKLEYRADKTGIVHMGFGKVNFSNENLLENLTSFYKSIEQNKPSGVKGRYFKTLYICTTMGPSIMVDLTSFKIK
jgi:large subunit ribosomal protein L1